MDIVPKDLERSKKSKKIKKISLNIKEKKNDKRPKITKLIYSIVADIVCQKTNFA